MAKKTIFVIDDDPMITILLEHILSREGYEIAKASDGREAVDMGQAMKVAPDLVISDNMLPFLSGVELVPILRSLDGWERVPIVMLTAKGQEADIRRAFDAGADDYLVKPFQPGELLARLKRFVR
ncbi:MAG: response regulator transcription factor [Fibrobacterota bacterium]|nr:response regulator transcription factor [Fibrobacterota bacterium]QQS07521.1 MAG: response regulator transcription factor [Fibrobacterota bacterium]